MQDTQSKVDFQVIREAWGLAAASHPAMRAIDLRVIMVLQSYLNKDNLTAFPSVSTIAKNIGKSTRTVQMSIAHIANHGLLAIERRWDKRRGCWQSSRYMPLIPHLNEPLQDRYREHGAVSHLLNSSAKYLATKQARDASTALAGRKHCHEKLHHPPEVKIAPPSRSRSCAITSDLTLEGTSSSYETSPSATEMSPAVSDDEIDLVMEAIHQTLSVQKQAIYAYLRDSRAETDMATIARTLKDHRLQERVKTELGYELRN
jgi:hypothetical protein